MTDNNNTTSRGFSYAEPILYRGNTYPSAPSSILDERGIERKGRIFTDANGQYYTLDANGNALPAMMTETLPEVEVRPSQEDTLSTMFSRYLTMGNDKSRVNNVPHREYNQHLTESALNGAKAHSSWDKDHPNLSAWRDFTTAIPFGVAAAPLAGGLGETALGQAATDKVLTTMAQPLVEMANNALGIGFASNGIYNITQGNFTPSTAMDLMGLPVMAKTTMSIAKGLKRNHSDLGKYLTNESAMPRSVKREGVKRYMDFIESPEYKNRFSDFDFFSDADSHWQQMRDIANERLNRPNYFPGRNQKIISTHDNPYDLGLASVNKKDPKHDPWEGITLKSSLYPNNVIPTLDHEIAHYATENAGMFDRGFLGDIMRHNETLAPNISWENMLRKELQSKPNMTIDEAKELGKRYDYLTDPQEKRARAVSIFQQAKDNKMTTDDFVDMWTAPNGEIYDDAPEQLKDMSRIFAVDNLKKYLNKFLGISAPIGIGASLMYNQTLQSYDK